MYNGIQTRTTRTHNDNTLPLSILNIGTLIQNTAASVHDATAGANFCDKSINNYAKY